MDIINKKIGIWGLGIGGKSALKFLAQQGCRLTVMDRKLLSDVDYQWLAQKSISYFDQNKSESFFNYNDYILPSAGIDLRPYAQYQHKWLSELDLFAYYFKKPIIAITGTIGKTTVTHVLSILLSNMGKSISTGGNIGVGMFDLIAQQTASDYAVLEVSSFQLEPCITFAPDLALWTNFYPNHLDRHNSERDYFLAKLNLLRMQTADQQALLPLTIAHLMQQYREKIRSQLNFFTMQKLSDKELIHIRPKDSVFFIEENMVMKYQHNIVQSIVNCDKFPRFSFPENWLIISAALSLLNLPVDQALSRADQLQLPEHRLHKIATINDVDYYNDSKATIAQATLAAIDTLQGKPILLLLGGVSKGVNRDPFIQQLKNKVNYIFCFGSEAILLQELCMKNNIPSSTYATLEDAFKAAHSHAQKHDQILFSPAGASFDLFPNYLARGERFKELVTQLQSR